MRAVTQYAYGGTDRLSLRDVAQPGCGPGEVRIRVRAAGLSPGDRSMITGVPYVNRLAASGVRRPKNPIAGYDVAGVVESVGSSVTRFETGDDVFGIAESSFAEYAVAAEEQLAHKPATWSFVEAAAVPESGCVALQAVRDQGNVQHGDRVAIVGAAGGVGSYAVQIAKSLGARVTGVCGATKLDAVLQIGADEVVDHTSQNLAEVGEPFDVVIDTAGKTPLRCLRRALTTRGRLVIVGSDHSHRFTGGLDRWIRALLWSPFVRQTLRPFVARPLASTDLEDLRDRMARGDLVPVVDRSFTFADVAEAMDYLDHRDGVGKVVLTWD